MRPAVSNYHSGQHCHSGNSGDRPYPPRRPAPATELRDLA